MIPNNIEWGSSDLVRKMLADDVGKTWNDDQKIVVWPELGHGSQLSSRKSDVTRVEHYTLSTWTQSLYKAEATAMRS